MVKLKEETSYMHEMHIKRQRIIHELQDKIRMYLECPYYHKYFEFVRINNSVVIDYDDFKKILKKDSYLWCNLSHDIYLDLKNVEHIMIY